MAESELQKKSYEPPKLCRFTPQEAKEELRAKGVPADTGVERLLQLILELERKSA